MSKVGKGSLAVLVAAVAVFAVAKFALWFTVRQVVDEGIARLSPSARVSYAGITTSFGGRVGLRGVRIEIPLLGDEVRIAHTQLKFDTLGQLLRFRNRLQEGKLPDRVALSLQGVQLDTRGHIASLMFDTAQRQPGAGGLGALNDVACGDGDPIGTTDLLAMGYSTLRGDVEYAYRLDSVSHRLVFEFESRSEDFGKARVQATVDNMPDKPGDALVAPPRLSHASFEMLDNLYQSRLQTYCAGRNGGSPAAFLDAEVERLDRVLRSEGVALGTPVLEGYRRYLEEPRRLRIEMDPSEGLVWGRLDLFKAEDVLAMLKLRITVNQQPVEPVSFEWLGDAPAAPEGAQPDLNAKAPVPPQRVPRYEYVSVDSLPRHAGKRLQLVTFDGTYYQGVLRKVENDKAYLNVQIGTGSADMFLRLNKIDKVRVLF